MSDKDTIRRALNDAIDWQASLADAVRHCKDSEYENCLEQIKRYRILLNRRYGSPLTQSEQAIKALGPLKLVSIDDIK